MVKSAKTLFPVICLAILLSACASETPSSSNLAPLDAQAAAGQALFTRHCAACHSLSPDTVVVGPALAGIADRAGQRVAGLDADTYLHQSILEPSAYVVEGFADLMPPTLAQVLTSEEIDALVAYMHTLH